MDTTTHGLTGYIIAKTGIARDTGKWGTIAGVSAAVLPDIDLALGFLGTEFSLKYHRYLTNSVFLIIPFSLLLAWVFVKISKIKRFAVFFLIAVVEITAHTFMDLMTSYGTMILSPLSSRRFALDWVFIVDFFLASALLLPFLGLFLRPGKTERLARVSVLLAALYVGLCAYNHSWALSLTKGYARANGLATSEVASLPQPLSPFRWANYIQTEERIYYGFVNLIATFERDPDGAGNFLSRFLARYQPISRLQYRVSDRFDRSPWVDKAVRSEGAKTFFWFARFPVARYRAAENGNHRVEFFDLRFGTMNDYKPFMYVVDFNPQGDVVFEGFL